MYDEEIEEIEEIDEVDEVPGGQEDEGEDDADMEPAAIPIIHAPITPTDIEMGTSTPASAPIIAGVTVDEGSDGGEEADLFGGADDEDEDSGGDDAMEEVQTTPSNGVKRKLVEEEDYD